MIELILMQRVDKLGQMGELVKVRPGYARNFLLPSGKATKAPNFVIPVIFPSTISPNVGCI